MKHHTYLQQPIEEVPQNSEGEALCQDLHLIKLVKPKREEKKIAYAKFQAHEKIYLLCNEVIMYQCPCPSLCFIEYHGLGQLSAANLHLGSPFL